MKCIKLKRNRNSTCLAATHSAYSNWVDVQVGEPGILGKGVLEYMCMQKFKPRPLINRYDRSSNCYKRVNVASGLFQTGFDVFVTISHYAARILGPPSLK